MHLVSVLIMNFGHTPGMLVWISAGWVNQADMWNLSRNFINGSQQKTPTHWVVNERPVMTQMKNFATAFLRILRLVYGSPRHFYTQEPKEKKIKSQIRMKLQILIQMQI